MFRYLAGVALTSLALTAATIAAPPPGAAARACLPAHGTPYSARALRRFRAILQLRVLEARRARLALVQGAIEHRLTVDQLLALPDDAAILAQGSNERGLKHLLSGATSTWGRCR
ncbi:MAG TPA: hypothetical protein VMD47_04320 [Candidatus Acidoferrales bacterium]|nr:hypothetical protein [Candidatus Acidoferrales bacterium]